MNAMNLSPLFRTAIGFDRLARMADTAAAADTSSLPPLPRAPNEPPLCYPSPLGRAQAWPSDGELYSPMPPPQELVIPMSTAIRPLTLVGSSLANAMAVRTPIECPIKT